MYYLIGHYTKAIIVLIAICLTIALIVKFGASTIEATETDALHPTNREVSTETAMRGRFNGKLVITSDRHNVALNIWTMNPDGSSPTRLTFPTPRSSDLPPSARVYDDTAAWSPDGAKIAFVSQRSDQLALYVMNADSSNVKQLIDQDSLQVGEIVAPTWSPDGTKIIFAAGFPVVIEPTKPTVNIYLINADGGNAVLLTQDSGRASSTPTWSPDGKQIAFASNRDNTQKIYIMNADGSNQHAITNPTQSYREYHDFFPSWSPDGTKIMFVGTRNDGSGNCQGGGCEQIYTVSPDGSNLTQVTNDPATRNLIISPYFTPKWSPDGTKIVFTRELTTFADNSKNFDRGRAVFVMNADGSNQQRITFRSDFSAFDVNANWQPLNTPANLPSSVVGFSAPTYQAFEDSGSIPIIVTRTGNLNDVASVYYATEDGTATVKYNYAPVLGTLRFAAGEASKTILVPLTDNGNVLGNRSFKISLLDNEGNATFVGGIREATITVLDRDTTPRATNPIDDTRNFVRQHYVDFLNREPDADGLAFWMNQITSCGSDAKCIDIKRQNVSAAFYLSTEFQETGYFFVRLRTINPDPTTANFLGFERGVQALNRGVVVGQPGWQQQLDANKTALIQQLFDDDRAYLSFGRTNAEYVDLLYLYTETTPAKAVRDALVNGLDAGTETRPSVFRKVVDDEGFKRQFFNRVFVLMEYYGYLRRDPERGGYNFWLNKLTQFNGDYIRSEMVRSFILSTEYRQRFGNQ